MEIKDTPRLLPELPKRTGSGKDTLSSSLFRLQIKFDYPFETKSFCFLLESKKETSERDDSLKMSNAASLRLRKSVEVPIFFWLYGLLASTTCVGNSFGIPCSLLNGDPSNV